MYIPPVPLNYTVMILNTNARHNAGRFAFIYLPGEILFQLTKVNKHMIFVYKSVSYNYSNFASLRLENTIVNKTGYSNETIQFINYSINEIILLD